MIEIEKNFDLRAGDRERIIKDAEFIGRKTYIDIYFDTEGFQLTRCDFWLRERNGKWELKVPVRGVDTRDGGIDRYTELENDEEIIKKLKLPPGVSLTKSFRERGIVSFARIVTNRETYQKDEFHLDFDEMDFGFTTFEVELMVSSESDVPDAERKIGEFASMHGVDSTKGRGKVIQYLFLNSPKHYRALVDAGIVRE